MSIRLGDEVYNGKQWGKIVEIVGAGLYHVELPGSTEAVLVYDSQISNYRRPKSGQT